MTYERLQKAKYAGICGDMRRVRHFWRKVPEMRKGGSKRLVRVKASRELRSRKPR
jgi:hypothetical protein